MRCTIKEVAKLANTSVATVSLVLNNKAGVKESTRHKVLEAVEALNYRPNQMARSLVNQKTNTIGFVVSDIKNQFYANLAYNMQKVFEENDFNLIMGISNNKVNNEKKIIESMIQRDVEGIILVPARDGDNDLKHLYDLRDLGKPFIFITNAYQGIQADCVMTDFEQATFELTDYLLSRGDRKIMFISENRNLLHAINRINGYKRAFRKNNLKYEEDWIVEIDADAEHALKVTQDILLSQKPDAIIAINAISALGVMTCLKNNNVKVPDEISVACFDDLEYASILYTPLTLIKQPLNLICEKTVELITKRIKDDKSSYEQILLPCDLVIRESTK